MKANELRIGNWVRHNDQWCYRGEDVYEFQWEDRDWYALGESTMSLENISPITLTEEWLRKFEFTTKYSIDWESNCGLLELETTDAGLLFDSGLIIKSVHQLQNLYFALTGEELKLIEG